MEVHDPNYKPISRSHTAKNLNAMINNKLFKGNQKKYEGMHNSDHLPKQIFRYNQSIDAEGSTECCIPFSPQVSHKATENSIQQFELNNVI